MSALAGCATAALSPEGARVAVARNPPAPDCVSQGYLVGEGAARSAAGGSERRLIGYAMNDLHNKAAKLGAN